MRLASLLLVLLAAGEDLVAQKRIACPDGDHFEIDLKQIQIQYDASSFAGTLSSLLGARLEVAPKKLQEAAAATQQWDVLLKGLVAGYNTCAVTRQQYADGLNRIYPRLKEDAADLEQPRKTLSEGRKADEKRLQNLVDSYYSNLRQFAQSAGKEIILERVEAVSQQVANVQSGQVLMQQGQQQQITMLEVILAKVNELTAKSGQAPLATPTEVSAQIAELRSRIGKADEPQAAYIAELGSLTGKAAEAQTAYKQGYELLDQYHFQQALPYLQKAVASVPLPEFYLSLGRAYEETPDLERAEEALREGLAIARREDDEIAESRLSNQLGILLQSKGDLEGAFSYMRRALDIDEKLHEPDRPEVAILANNIGQLLLDKGDLDRALSYGQRALKIDEKLYGPDDPALAAVISNIGQILQAKGDLDGALSYAHTIVPRELSTSLGMKPITTISQILRTSCHSSYKAI